MIFPEQTQPCRTQEGLQVTSGQQLPLCPHPGPRKPVSVSWAAVGETGEAGGDLLTSAQPQAILGTSASCPQAPA